MEPTTPLFSGYLNVVLAAVVLASWGAIAILWKQLKEEQAGRLQDLKDSKQEARDLTREISQQNELLYTKIEAARNGNR